MTNHFPSWLKKRFPPEEQLAEVRELLSDLGLNTVCQSAECPNRGECFSKKTATFMILGNTCTRNCRFCNVLPGKPEEVNPEEPLNIARAVAQLGLKHVVITSVTRDDLPDGGVGQFMKTVQEIKKAAPEVIVELLTPDFKGNEGILRDLLTVNFEVFNHNLETVERLSKEARPQADYNRSLQVLAMVKKIKPDIYTKSGLMVGLGEQKDEVIAAMQSLLDSGCDILTIGQYLRPTSEHLAVEEFVSPERFAEYKEIGEGLGFKAVFSGPFVRSSYYAADLFQELF